MNNKLTTVEVLNAIANNWNGFSKEEQEQVAKLFANHSVEEIIIGYNCLLINIGVNALKIPTIEPNGISVYSFLI